MLLDIFDPKAPPKAIGIDLGTTHSLVAHVREGQPVELEGDHVVQPRIDEGTGRDLDLGRIGLEGEDGATVGARRARQPQRRIAARCATFNDAACATGQNHRVKEPPYLR